MTKIEKFAEAHRVKIRRDECNDQVIEGRRGQMYFDGNDLCLMAIDRKPAQRSSWEALGGNMWLGDISPNAKGQRVQDVKITGITNAKAAFRMAGIFAKRVLSPERLASLEQARLKIAPKLPLLEGH